MARFQSTFKKTILTFLAIAAMAGLGTWQLERREWKNNLIKSMEEREKMPVLNQIPKDIDYNQIEFRRVAITGLIDESKILFLGPRTRGTDNGYYMYVPMFLQDRRVVLVNQGFISHNYLNLVKPGRGTIKAVTGTLRQPAQPGLFTPKNEEGTNRYFWLDMMTIGQRLGTPGLLPIVLELDSTAASQYSMGAQVHEPIVNNHLQYAITWYALAAIAFIYYLMTSFRSPGIIEAGFRMKNMNLEQSLPYGGARNGPKAPGNGAKPFHSKDDDGPNLWS